MIISHRHRFIFLHCRKTAGSTVKTLLNAHLGPQDIQLGSWADTIEAGGRYNRKVWTTIAGHGRSRALMLRGILGALRRGQRPQISQLVNAAVKYPYTTRLAANPPHATAAEIRAFDPEAWAGYFTFCFVRNPYHHAVSDYYWRGRTGTGGVDFEEFLRRKLDPARPDPEHLVARPATNWPIYTIDDRVAVDFVGRYETLAEDLARISERLGFDLQLDSVPRAKAGHRRRDPREIYTDETRRLAEEIYRKEIDAFGYGFE